MGFINNTGFSLLITGSVNDNILLPVGDNQTLSVHVTLRPASSMGVLFALVRQDRVPFSISLSDYHPGTLQWTEVRVR